MNVSSVLRPAQRILATSVVAAVAVSGVLTGVLSAAGHPAAGHGSSVGPAPSKKEYAVSAAKKELLASPAKKEYLVSPAKKEYLVSPAKKEFLASPAKKEYVASPAKKEYALVAVSAV
jgi:hypothetical protein